MRTAYAWVWRAAHLLENPTNQAASVVETAYDDLLAEMVTHATDQGGLTSAIQHFLKVTASYAPDLFHCYDVPGLPRTNNDLEHTFGTARHHERRATGRKTGDSGLVLRGQVRLLASVVGQCQVMDAADLMPTDLLAWQAMRQELNFRAEARRAQHRFRHDPAAYLATLESRLLQSSLPP